MGTTKTLFAHWRYTHRMAVHSVPLHDAPSRAPISAGEAMSEKRICYHDLDRGRKTRRKHQDAFLTFLGCTLYTTNDPAPNSHRDQFAGVNGSLKLKILGGGFWTALGGER